MSVANLVPLVLILMSLEHQNTSLPLDWSKEKIYRNDNTRLTLVLFEGVESLNVQSKEL